MDHKPVLLRFKIKDFDKILSRIDDHEYTNDQTDCNGHDWWITIAPAGEMLGDESSFKLQLEADLNSCYFAKFTVSVKNAKGDVVLETQDGDSLFMSRSFVVNPANGILKYGTLSVEIFSQVMDDKENGPWGSLVRHHKKLRSPLQYKMLDLLGNKEKADIIIKAGGHEFYMHSLILENNAPILSNYCKQDAMDHIDPNVFQMILKHVYTGYSPIDNEVFMDGRDIVSVGKEFIDAANRFELSELKKSVERILIREGILDKSNVVDYLLFADAQSCPLLKRYAISIFALFAREILKSDDSKSLRESGEPLTDIIMMMADNDEDED